MAMWIPELGYLRQAKPRPYRGQPLHLTAAGSIPANAGGSGVNAAALKAPLNKPCVLSAVKFQIQPTTLAQMTNVIVNLGAVTSASLGQTIAASLIVAKYDEADGVVEANAEPLSNGRPPIGAICPAVNPSAEALLSATAAFNVTQAPISEYRWDFEKPFYVPAGCVVVPQLQHLGGFFFGNGVVGANKINPIPALSVRVSYEGSLLETARDYTEDYIHVPYAAAYTAALVGLNPQSYNDVSPENALANPFRERVMVTQMVGRLLWPGGQSESTVDIGPGLEVRLTKSNGDALVPFFGEFRSIFDRQTRAWACRLALDPGEYVSAVLTGANALGSSQQSAQLFGNTIIKPTIGMTGYRDIPREALESA